MNEEKQKRKYTKKPRELRSNIFRFALTDAEDKILTQKALEVGKDRSKFLRELFLK